MDPLFFGWDWGCVCLFFCSYWCFIAASCAIFSLVCCCPSHCGWWSLSSPIYGQAWIKRLKLVCLDTYRSNLLWISFLWITLQIVAGYVVHLTLPLLLLNWAAYLPFLVIWNVLRIILWTISSSFVIWYLRWSFLNLSNMPTEIKLLLIHFMHLHWLLLQMFPCKVLYTYGWSLYMWSSLHL